jgi:hypothetical protein
MRISATLVGLMVGIALGFGAVIDGFVGFIVMLVLAAAGLIVGRVVDGELDLTDYLGGRRRRDQ